VQNNKKNGEKASKKSIKERYYFDGEMGRSIFGWGDVI
jgi:hypothetical protein